MDLVAMRCTEKVLRNFGGEIRQNVEAKPKSVAMHWPVSLAEIFTNFNTRNSE
jgi:hypothetical protein